MKTVMKKLLSVMLVALLLVSAVPFQASATDGTGYKVKLEIYVNEVYKETIEQPANSENEMLAWAKLSAAAIVEELDLSYFDPETDKVTGFANTPSAGATSLTYNIWITTDDSSDTPEGGIVEEYKLTVNTGVGTYTLDVSYGDEYLEVLAPPARPGREFKGWESLALGGKVKEGDSIEGNDTVTAIWSALAEYNLTLDPNRGLTEDVNYGVKVVYGDEDLYTKVMRYQPEREGYVFMGWKLNGKIIDADDVYELQGDATAYAEWKLESDTEDVPMGGGTTTADGKVYLEIYTNGDTSKYVKRVEITKYADDNKITRAEVEAVAKQYVTAKTGYTLSYEGLFDEESWWWYTRDPETDGEPSIIVNRDGDDYIYVMVKNVKAVEADPTNPKTGDMIFVPMIFMVGSAAALALETKKRFVK